MNAISHWTTALCINCRSIWKQVMEIYHQSRIQLYWWDAHAIKCTALLQDTVQISVLFVWKSWKQSCWKCAHPQAIQDANEFVSSSDLEKCSIASVSQQWMLCSEWVPSEWESKQLIKTSQVIHTTPVHQLTFGEEKSYICMKQIL